MPPTATMEETRKAFAEQRHVKLDALLEDGLIHVMYKHFIRRAEAGLPAGMGHNGTAVEMFADPLLEFVLAGVQPRIEERSGLILAHTYSFVRIYRHGNDLKRHRDRPSCEVSVSLNLGTVLEDPWPLSIKGPLGESAIARVPGGAVLNRGIECEHWREPFQGDHLAQLFRHYVETDGKRPMLGT